MRPARAVSLEIRTAVGDPHPRPYRCPTPVPDSRLRQLTQATADEAICQFRPPTPQPSMANVPTGRWPVDASGSSR